MAGKELDFRLKDVLQNVFFSRFNCSLLEAVTKPFEPFKVLSDHKASFFFGALGMEETGKEEALPTGVSAESDPASPSDDSC